ncbi:MAG: energy transducer TonB [Cyanosarcina radialis HA8281-LM2]|jgi:hypothetical protein|nr:energy transducer TonB [Cyanosarcina radialis HA8281-LM2]
MSSLSFVTDLSAKLLQPTVIAAIASIGAHSLLAMALPNLSTSGEVKEESTPDKVEIVELTPAERQRLPDLSPIPSQAYQTQPLSSVPLLPPHNNFSSTIPDIRLPPVRTANLPPIPPSARTSSPKTKPNKPTKTAKATKTRKPLKVGKTNKIAKVNKPSNSKQSAGTYRFFNQPTLKGKEVTSLPDGALADLPGEIAPKPPQTTNPKPTKPGSRTNKRPQRVAARNRSSRANRGRSPIARKPNNSQSPPRRNPKKPIARSSKPAATPATPNPQPSVTPTPATDDRAVQQALIEQELERSLTRNEVNTSDREAQRNYLNWIAKGGLDGKREEITIAGTYPQDACLKQLNGSASVAILVEPNKRPIGQGELIKSSGYSVFDRQALGDALSANFDNKTERSKIYLVTVEYKYNREACPPVGKEGERGSN